MELLLIALVLILGVATVPRHIRGLWRSLTSKDESVREERSWIFILSGIILIVILLVAMAFSEYG